jgi:hypothetical protein
MANKEKEIELKVKAEKISKEHLQELQKHVNVVNSLQFNIGKVESQKHQMLHELFSANSKIIEMQDTLQKEYGTYDVNVTDGTINWKKDEK